MTDLALIRHVVKGESEASRFGHVYFWWSTIFSKNIISVFLQNSMPYKRPYKKRTYKRKAPTRGQAYGGAVSQLYKDVKMLKNLINVEFKRADQTASTTSSTAGNTILLNGLQKGDDFQNRDGRQVRIKSVQVQLRVTMAAAATTTCFRYFILLDKQPNTTGFAMSDVLDTAVAGGVDAFRQLSNRKRFVILKQQRLVLDSDDPSRVIQFYKKLDLKTIYDDSDTGAIADVTTNALYLYMMSDQGANVPTVIYNARLRFIDN